MNGILLATIVIGGTGLAIGILLGIAGKLLEIKVDEKEVNVRSKLPGNNCGGCGYAGCDSLAKAIAEGNAPVNACPVGGSPVAAEIAAIMGTDAGESVRMMAVVKCKGTCDKTVKKYNYYGNNSCIEAMQLDGGNKACATGCMGLGSCVKTCPFGAISIVDGVASVDREKCKACGKCIAVCPKHVIELIPYENEHFVACSNKNPGKQVREVCQAGCIGCKMCEKNCPVDAIHVVDNIATIDYSKCVVCTACKDICPMKTIK